MNLLEAFSVLALFVALLALCRPALRRTLLLIVGVTALAIYAGVALTIPSNSRVTAQVPPTCDPYYGRHCDSTPVVTPTPDGTRPATITQTPTATATPCIRRGLPCDFAP